MHGKWDTEVGVNDEMCTRGAQLMWTLLNHVESKFHHIPPFQWYEEIHRVTVVLLQRIPCRSRYCDSFLCFIFYWQTQSLSLSLHKLKLDGARFWKTNCHHFIHVWTWFKLERSCMLNIVIATSSLLSCHSAIKLKYTRYKRMMRWYYSTLTCIYTYKTFVTYHSDKLQHIWFMKTS